MDCVIIIFCNVLKSWHKFDTIFIISYFLSSSSRKNIVLSLTSFLSDLFLGANITEPVIEHLKQQHGPKEMVCANPGN